MRKHLRNLILITLIAAGSSQSCYGLKKFFSKQKEKLGVVIEAYQKEKLENIEKRIDEIANKVEQANLPEPIAKAFNNIVKYFKDVNGYAELKEDSSGKFTVSSRKAGKQIGNQGASLQLIADKMNNLGITSKDVYYTIFTSEQTRIHLNKVLKNVKNQEKIIDLLAKILKQVSTKEYIKPFEKRFNKLEKEYTKSMKEAGKKITKATDIKESVQLEHLELLDASYLSTMGAGAFSDLINEGNKQYRYYETIYKLFLREITDEYKTIKKFGVLFKKEYQNPLNKKILTGFPKRSIRKKWEKSVEKKEKAYRKAQEKISEGKAKPKHTQIVSDLEKTLSMLIDNHTNMMKILKDANEDAFFNFLTKAGLTNKIDEYKGKLETVEKKKIMHMELKVKQFEKLQQGEESAEGMGRAEQ